MEAQMFADLVLPPTHGHLILRSIVLLICAWITSLFCHLVAFPAVSVYPLDSRCIVYIVYPDAGSHEAAVHKTTALRCVCHPCE